MATATSPVPDDRGPKRQKGDEHGSSSQGGPAEGSYSSRPPQHPSQMYSSYMGGPPGPYMGGPGVPPYGQYGGPHGHPPPPHHGGYGGMYGGGGPRGHGSPERQGRPSAPPPGPPGGPGPWSGYRGGPPSSGGGGRKKEEKDPNGGGPPHHHSYHAGGWGHPQYGHPYGHPPPGYGGHPSMPGPGMYSQGGSGAWNGGQPAPGGELAPHAHAHGPSPTASANRTPPRSRPRLEASPPPTTRQAPQPAPAPPQQQRADSSYCLEVSSVPTDRNSVTHDMMNEDGSSVSGSQKDKGRGSYKCGRCGVPKKGHICPYQPKLKRRPDEPPPETRCAAVQVEMDEFMTLRRLNIRIQGLPESYATEPFIGASMVGAESRPPEIFEPLDDRPENEEPLQKREIMVSGERDATAKEEKMDAYN